MKSRSLFFSILLLFSSLTSFVNIPQNTLLLKKWKIEFSTALQAMPATAQTHYQNLTEAQKATVRADVERATWEFKEAGVFVQTYSDGETAQGTWSLSSNQKYLTMSVDGNTFTHEIKTLNATTLVIKNNEGKEVTYHPL
jgi:hypothetical protein